MSVHGPFKRNSWDSNCPPSHSTTILTGIYSHKLWGFLSLHWNSGPRVLVWGWDSWLLRGKFHSQDIPPNFYFILFILFSITIYPPSILFHLPSFFSPYTQYTVLCVHEFSLFYFLFCSTPPLPSSTTLTALSVCSLSMNLSLFCLLVQFVH